MFASMARKMSSFFIANDVIEEDEKEIYNYSIEVLISTITNFSFIIIAAIIMNRVMETAFYLMGFLPLRRSAGGYHAKTHFHCLCILIASYSMFLLIIFFVSNNSNNYCVPIILLISFLIIFNLSPIEDKNKPVTSTEKSHFCRKSRIIILIYCFAIPFICHFSKTAALSSSLGIFTVSLSLIAAKWRNSTKSQIKTGGNFYEKR